MSPTAGEELDLDEVERISNWVAAHAPHWIRDDVRAEARLAAIEAHERGKAMTTAAYRRGMHAVAAARYLTGMWLGRHPYSHNEAVPERVSLGLVHDIESTTVSEATSGEFIIARVADELARRGLDHAAVTTALEVLCDAATHKPSPRTSARDPRAAVHDLPATRMATTSGLTREQCAALKVLILGERPRAGRINTPGLLVRAQSDPEIWRDPRVLQILTVIATQPTKRLIRPWSSDSSAGEVRRSA